ncbi:hypothetical protein RRG08_022572 [Elysia crispata]|uniref:Uncharacterized protein n=1 Tax=Elysia crispata TaxID=231223 RepID=A0AAE0Z2W8_9GAST|nr:hypothetical protein RRG08_022572 [Elysia crispata]
MVAFTKELVLHCTIIAIFFPMAETMSRSLDYNGVTSNPTSSETGAPDTLDPGVEVFADPFSLGRDPCLPVMSLFCCQSSRSECFFTVSLTTGCTFLHATFNSLSYT